MKFAKVYRGLMLLATGSPAPPDPARLHANRLAGPVAVAVARNDGSLRLWSGPDEELHLDAVAHDPGQRLGDQGAVAGLQPVLGEAVGNGNPEPVVLDLDQAGVTQPRLVVRRRERHLQLAEGCAPDLLRIHRWRDLHSEMGYPWVASTVSRGRARTDARWGRRRRGWRLRRPLEGVLRAPGRDALELPGAEGSRRIAPPGGPSQGFPAPDFSYPRGVSRRRRRAAQGADAGSRSTGLRWARLAGTGHLPRNVPYPGMIARSRARSSSVSPSPGRSGMWTTPPSGRIGSSKSAAISSIDAVPSVENSCGRMPFWIVA